MTATLLVALATFLFEDYDLLVLLVFENGDLDGCTLDKRSAEASVGTFAYHEDFVDVDRVSSLRFRVGVYFEDITFRYGELATLCFDSGFHGKVGEQIVLGTEIKTFFRVFWGFWAYSNDVR